MAFAYSLWNQAKIEDCIIPVLKFQLFIPGCKLDLQLQVYEQQYDLSDGSKAEILELLGKQEDISGFSSGYSKPLQGWIEGSCGSSCPSLHPLDDYLDLQVSRIMFSPALMQIPAHKHWHLMFLCFG